MVSEAIRGVSWSVSVTRAWTDALLVRPTVAVISRVAVLVIEQVSDDVLEGDTIDRILDRAETEGVAQRIADRLLADGIAEQLADRILSGPELERVVELALESPGVERIVERSLDSPGVERIVERALESPGVERIITRVIESRVVDETVVRVMDEVAQRIPESAAIWALIDEIAQSPAVTDAITQQGVGFADQVAGEVRDRSRTVDDRLERAVWRLFRRHPRTPGGGDEPTPMGAT
jgi:hypothetical protein